MGKNKSASGLTNFVQYDNQGNIYFVSGSNTLMSISSSGAITTTGPISGSTALSASNAVSSSYSLTGTTAATASSITALNQNVQVTGSLGVSGNITAGSTGQVSLFGTSNTSDKYLSINNSAGTFDFGTNSTGNYIQANNSNPLKFFVNTSNNAMFISSSGNVGIGTTTPSDVLDVQKNQNAITNFYFRNTDTTNANSRAYLNVVGGSTSLTLASLNSGDNYIAGTSGKSLYFQQNIGGTVNMTISSSGFVGIGTTTPASRLDLGTGTGGTSLTIQDGFVKHITSGYVVGSQYYYGSNQYGQIAASSTGFNFNTYNGVNMTFGNGSYSPYLQFKSGGGTTYGNYITMDNANDFMAIAAGTDAGYAYGPYMQMVGKNRYGTNTAGWIDYAAGNASSNTSYGYHAFYTANTLRMAISWNGSIGTTSIGSTNIYNPSDVRLKRNIVPIAYGLDAVLALKPSKFNWREKFSAAEEDKDLLGFIAQEVQTVIPEAVESFGQTVHVNTGGVEYTVEDPLRVNEKFLIPVLVKAIQELKTELDAAKAEIELLKQR